MTDATSYSRQSRWFFILVCANFTLLAVLFVGLGILLLQSIGLVGSLRSDLPRAEEAVAQLRERFDHIEPEAAVDRIVGSTVKSIREGVRQAVSGSRTDGCPGHGAGKHRASIRFGERNGRNPQGSGRRVGRSGGETKSRGVIWPLCRAPRSPTLP